VGGCWARPWALFVPSAPRPVPSSLERSVRAREFGLSKRASEQRRWFGAGGSLLQFGRAQHLVLVEGTGAVGRNLGRRIASDNAAVVEPGVRAGIGSAGLALGVAAAGWPAAVRAFGLHDFWVRYFQRAHWQIPRNVIC